MREVLGGAAQHRRAADVDHLDGLLLADAVAAGDLTEGIKVHADEIEWCDLLRLECGNVVRTVAPREDRSVDARVQSLDAPTEHLCDAGQLFDAVDVEPNLLLEEVGRAAACDELPAELGETARKSLQA